MKFYVGSNLPLFKNLKKVLIIGSGAIKIGEAGEFDYSGAQAIKAVKEEGIEVVLINPNVATIQTDSKFVGDKAYFLPITIDHVESIIDKERPDGILLSFGGQTALNCGVELAEKRILEKYGVKVLGTGIEAIERADNRQLFRETMINADVPILRSKKANTVEKAVTKAYEIGYPVMVRVAYTLGGQGTGVAYNKKQLEEIVAVGLVHSRIHQVLIEEYVGGWKEIEYEVLRDHDDNCMILCSMENFDPMGVHTGDSIVVAPSQTVSDGLYHKLRATSFTVLRALDLVGECNIQFAVHPITGVFRVIEVNSRLSRSSALASKATGYPIAYVTAKIALGYNIHEIINKTSGLPAASLEPDIDYIVVKMPRWDFHKFRNVDRRLGTQMKSVGEVMAIAKTFEEALQKAVRMLGINMELTTDSYKGFSPEEIKKELANPTDERLFYIVEALRQGMTVEEVHELSKITGLFLEGIERILKLEEVIKKSSLSKDLLIKAKCLGFSDKTIGNYTFMTEADIRKLRESFDIKPYVKQIRTAKRFSEYAEYLYYTYNDAFDDVDFPRKRKVVVLGSGCYRIGSSVEFDWCCVNMAWALKDHGVPEVIMVNCNPETVSTDFDVLDKLYFEELTLERILDILDKEDPEGVVTSVGGQIPNNLAKRLAAYGVKILGTSAENIDRAEDRAKFSTFLDSIGVKQPRWSKLETVESAKSFADETGYPVLVRPSYVLSGTAMNVAYNEKQLEAFLMEAVNFSKEHPIVLSKFMTGSMEVEVDGICDGENVFLGAIIEHLEYAGVHSGDATMVVPSKTVSIDEKEKIIITSRKIAKGLEIKGPFNIQYLVKNGEVYVIETNLRASRSMPFVSKVSGVNLMDMASYAITGEKIEEGEASIDRFGVKSPVFSFMRMKGMDPLTGVEMVSTGEVAAFSESFNEALINSIIASGVVLPKRGDGMLFSVGKNKSKAVDIAKKMMSLNLRVFATKKTSDALRRSGVECETLFKTSEGKQPKVLDYLEKGEIKLVINTPSPDNIAHNTFSDGFLIRRKAVDFRIPLITNFELADALTKALG